MKSLVSLVQWNNTRYLSALTSVAPGVPAGFNAFCCIRGISSTEQGNITTYFGNTDGSATGWSFRRLADVPADPLSGLPAFAVIAFVVAADTPVEISASVRIPLPFFVGRNFFLGGAFRGDGTDVSLYVNGARSSAPAELADAYVPGDSGLQYGVTTGELNLDGLVGAAFTTQNLNNDQFTLDLFHQRAFQFFVENEQGAVMQVTMEKLFADFSLTPPVEYVFDSWTQRGPFLSTPASLPNSGSSGGSLAYGGAPTVLRVTVDRNPHLAGVTGIPIVVP